MKLYFPFCLFSLYSISFLLFLVFFCLFCLFAFLFFSEVVLCIYRPWPNKSLLKFNQYFKACWSLCFEMRVLNESTNSMPWICCAFVLFCLLFFLLAFMKPLWRAINCSAANLSASLAPQFIPWRRYPILAAPSNDQWLMFYRDKTENKTQRLLSNKVCLQLWPAWSAKSFTSWQRSAKLNK